MNNNQSCIRIYADRAQINACQNKIQENKASFARLSNILALTGNEVRLKIMFLIDEEKELCPCDLADILGMSIPAVSQHLRKMKDGGIIEARRSGQTLYYSLKPENYKLLKTIFKHINITAKKEELV